MVMAIVADSEEVSVVGQEFAYPTFLMMDLHGFLCASRYLGLADWVS